MKRLFLTGVVGLLGVAGPLGAAALTGAGTAPAAASPKVALYHMPVLGKQVVPSLLGLFTGRFNATSTNWSGYAATNNTFQDISSSWVQPTVTCPTSGGGFLGLGGAPTSYSSFWVGLDGYTSTTVEQTGTDSDCNAGKPTYYAWYEMYPAASVDISSTTYPVTPGDTITGSVVSDGPGKNFTLALSDTSTKHANWTFSVPESAGSNTYARSSAEWIAEAPSTCSLLFCSVTSLADFHSVTFSNAVASTTAQPTVSKPISGYTNTSITMTSSTGSVKATPTGLNSAGNGFTVNWNAS